MLSFTVLFSLFLSVISDEKLKLAILMFRHGDRSAIGMIPDDIYNISSWPMGPGELTTIGMENHLRNGQFFRARYTDSQQKTFLGLDGNYKYGQVYVRSTDKDRTLMSAQSMLSGLFPPKENKLTSPLNVWQPIPVHTTPMSEEPMLDGSPSNCPEWTNSYPKTVTKNAEFISFMENRTNITNKILEVTGIEYQSDQYELFKSLANAYDTLFCEKSHNMTFKKEFQDIGLFDLLKPYGAMSWKTYMMQTDKEKALSGGVLLRELKNRVRDAVNNTSDVKLVLFSGHDTTLASILTDLGVYDSIQTPYATVLMLELWEGGPDGQRVQLHRHHLNESLLTYTLPGCNDTGCSLEQFYAINSDLELSAYEYKIKCKLGMPDLIPNLSKNVLFLMLCITILVCLSAISMLTFYTYRAHQKSGLYTKPGESDQVRALLQEDY